MFGLTPSLALPWLVLPAIAVAAPYLALVAFTKALRNYSRRRLEERCEERDRLDLADEITHLDERTSRASEALSTVAGFSLVVALGVGYAEAGSRRDAGPLFIGLLILIMLGHIASAAVGTVFAEGVIEAFWPASWVVRSAAAPVVFLIRMVERLVGYLGSEEEIPSRPASVEVEVPAESETSEDVEAELPEKARELLEHAVTLTRTDVSEIMTPRAEIISLPSTVTAREAARTFRETGRSRIPVYGENRDDVIGILYAKDLFPPLTDPEQAPRVVPADLVRAPFFVPESKNAFELLEELRAQRTQLAMILDEYGGVAGLITLEDLLEQLVGFIDDEHDVPTPDNPIRPLGESRYEIDATLPIEELNDRLELELPTDDGYQTAGGLALHSLGRVPELGDSFRLEDVEFIVAEVSDHAVRRLILDLKGREGAGDDR